MQGFARQTKYSGRSNHVHATVSRVEITPFYCEVIQNRKLFWLVIVAKGDSTIDKIRSKPSPIFIQPGLEQAPVGDGSLMIDRVQSQHQQ
jgi:hypothetical protein